MESTLREAADRAIAYLAEVDDRRVRPAEEADLSVFDGPFPEDAADPSVVVKLLDDAVGPATMATAGRRFFGWVIGGAHPAALGADWLTSAWDQNTLFAEGALVTGSTVANLAAWASASSRPLCRSRLGHPRRTGCAVHHR